MAQPRAAADITKNHPNKFSIFRNLIIPRTEKTQTKSLSKMAANASQITTRKSDRNKCSQKMTETNVPKAASASDQKNANETRKLHSNYTTADDAYFCAHITLAFWLRQMVGGVVVSMNFIYLKPPFFNDILHLKIFKFYMLHLPQPPARRNPLACFCVHVHLQANLVAKVHSERYETKAFCTTRHQSHVLGFT